MNTSENNNSFSNRERFLRTLRFQPVDHPPLMMDNIWASTLRRWIREGYPDGVSLGDYFGIQPLQFLNAGMNTGFYPLDAETVLEETDQQVVKRDAWGRVVRNLKQTMSMPEYLKYPVKTARDLQRIIEERFDPKSIPERRLKMPTQPALSSRIITFVDGGCYYDTLRGLAGVEVASMLFFDEPDLVHQLFDRIEEICLANLKNACSEGPVDYLGFGEDIAFKTSTLISPKMFREFILPRYKSMVDAARRKGIVTTWYDSDGNLDPLLNELFEAGINGFGPMEVAAGMDPVTLRKKYGRKIRMMGGIDKRQVARGKAWIDREIVSKVSVILDGGYIPYIDHSVSDDISLANYTYYIEKMKQLYGISDHPGDGFTCKFSDGEMQA